MTSIIINQSSSSFTFLNHLRCYTVQCLIYLVEMLGILHVYQTHQLAQILIVLHRKMSALIPQIHQHSYHTLQHYLQLLLLWISLFLYTHLQPIFLCKLFYLLLCSILSPIKCTSLWLFIMF